MQDGDDDRRTGGGQRPSARQCGLAPGDRGTAARSRSRNWQHCRETGMDSSEKLQRLNVLLSNKPLQRMKAACSRPTVNEPGPRGSSDDRNAAARPRQCYYRPAGAAFTAERQSVGRTTSMTRTIFIVLTLVCGIGWTRSVTASAAPKGPWLSFETTACLGICPVYTVRVFSSGRIEYDGKRFVIQRGHRFGRLPAGRLEKLRQAVTEAGFNDLPANCCDCHDKTDAPTMIIGIHSEEGTKSVRHYHGCLSAPSSISELEKKIVALTGVSRWIGTEAEIRKQKWNRNSQ